MEATHVYPSKTKSILFLALAIACLALFVTLVIWPFTDNNLHPKLWGVVIISPIPIILLLYCVSKIIRQTITAEPLFVLNKDGILEFGPYIGEQFIPWHEVEEIQKTKIHNNKLITIKVKDPLKIKGNLNRLDKFVYKLARFLGHHHPTYSAISTTFTHQELYKLFNEYFDAYKRQNGETETLPQ